MKMSSERKMRLKALWLWWQIIFLAFLMIGTVVFVRPESSSLTEIIPLMLRTALISAAAAVPAELLLYFIGFTVYKRKSSYGAISRIISEKGGASPEAAEMMKSKYESAVAAGRTSDAAEWAIYLAATYSDLGDRANARKYINAADMSGFMKDTKNEQNRFMIRSYYVALIGLDMTEGDREQAEKDYTAAFPFFEGVPMNDPHELSVKNLMGEYLIFSGNFPAAVQIADSIPKKDIFHEMTACIIRGTALINMKEFSRARDNIRRAAEINTNDTIGMKLKNLLDIIEAAERAEADINA